MAAGNSSSTRRGATIYELAEDDGPWGVLALRALDDLETRGDAAHILTGDATGKQVTVYVNHQPWSRRKLSLRALGDFTGTTCHNIEKTYNAAVETLGPPQPLGAPDEQDRAWANWRAFEGLLTGDHVHDEGFGFIGFGTVHDEDWGEGPHRSARGRGGPWVDAKGTHWPQERWQPPSLDGRGYGPVQVLPQDEFEDARQGRHFRTVK